MDGSCIKKFRCVEVPYFLNAVNYIAVIIKLAVFDQFSVVICPLASLGGDPDPEPEDFEPEPEPEASRSRKGVVTTEEELAVYEMVKEICVTGAGCVPDEILFKDTTNYFNISYKRPTKWFLRYFGDSQRKAVITMVPLEEVRTLCPGFEVEEAPPVFGVSRVYIDSAPQVSGLKALVLRALELHKAPPKPD